MTVERQRCRAVYMYLLAQLLGNSITIQFEIVIRSRNRSQIGSIWVPLSVGWQLEVQYDM